MENTIQSDLIRGHINTIILKALFDGDRYGYDIVREIEQKSSGQYKLKQPTLYSCLKRLEIQGFIRSYWGAKSNGGRRKYFTLTEMGRELFIKNQSEWEYSRTVIDKLISDREVDLSAPRPEAESVASQYDEQEASFNDEPETDEDISEITDSENAETENLSANEIQEDDENVSALHEQPDEEQRQEVVSRAVEFSDTTAIMDELFRSRLNSDDDASYAEKLVSEKYVSDRTDNNFSAEMYFRDFFDESEAEQEAEQSEPENEHSEQTPPLVSQNDEQYAQQYNSSGYEPHIEETFEQEEQKPENIFLDYHTSSIAKPYESGIIEREYRNILGDFLNASFVERPAPPPEEPEQEPEEPIAQDTYVQNQPAPAMQEETGTTASIAQAPATEQYEEPQTALKDSAESEYNEATEQYTNDADVNRKLNRITGEVREMGDNVVIRTHNNSSSKEYNNAYYYLSNKLMIVHYGILFGIMMLEILFSAIFVNVVLHAGRSSDKWFYIAAVLIAVAFPIVAFVKNFTAPDKRKRINFSLKNSLIYRLIVMAQCFLIIYCANVIGGMELGFELKYITTLLLPALLSVCFPISALIFNALFKSKKFAVEH